MKFINPQALSSALASLVRYSPGPSGLVLVLARVHNKELWTLGISIDYIYYVPGIGNGDT